ncbi:YybS family protein [Sporosarcina sp. CAU 1771]
MQHETTGKIVHGAMMIALFFLLTTITILIPVIGMLTLFFIPLPIILFRLKFDRTSSFFVTATGIFMSLLILGIFSVPYTFVFGLVGFIIGDTVQSRKTKLYTFMATGLTFVTTTILIYLATILFLKINIIDIVMQGLWDSQDLVTSLLVKFGELPENFTEQMNASISFYETSIPSTFIIGMFSLAYIYVTLNLTIVKRLGHPVQKFPPFYKMKLPVIMVWYYLIVLLAGFFLEIEQGTQAYVIYTNAMILIRFLFLLQGISLIHFFMKESKLPKWLTIVSTILAVMLSPITTLLGLVDVGFNVRSWIGKNKAK